MSETKHTPTPWHMSTDKLGNWSITIGPYKMTCVGDDIDQQFANADFVVTAVNAHAELVAALESVVDRNITFGEGMVIGGLDYKTVQVARAVLAKAKGEK